MSAVNRYLTSCCRGQLDVLFYGIQASHDRGVSSIARTVLDDDVAVRVDETIGAGASVGQVHALDEDAAGVTCAVDTQAGNGRGHHQRRVVVRADVLDGRAVAGTN